MYLTTQVLTTNNESIPTLLQHIERKLGEMGKREYNRVAYGIGSANYSKYEDLLIYREIFTDMQYCSDCYCDQDIPTIISGLKSLLNNC